MKQIQTISVKCETQDSLEIAEMTEFQGGLKKRTDIDFDKIKLSIIKFGFSFPFFIWKSEGKNYLLDGHGRFATLCKMQKDGYIIPPLPVVYVNCKDKADAKEKLLRLNSAYGKMTKDSVIEFLGDDVNISDISSEIVLPDGVIEFPSDDIVDDEEEAPNERTRTNEAYNLEDFDADDCEGFYQMPTIRPINYIPSKLIGFNYVLSAKEKTGGVHFYIDDYQFERIWNEPALYLEKIKDFECMLTPDFSLYSDMPMAMKVWNIYRSRLIGQMAQRMGIKVIPTVSWAEEETFDFCFDGLPHNSTLSISTIGVKREDECFEMWKAGVDEMIKRLTPRRLIVYGGKVEYDYGNIEVVYFSNAVTDRMKGGGL